MFKEHDGSETYLVGTFKDGDGGGYSGATYVLFLTADLGTQKPMKKWTRKKGRQRAPKTTSLHSYALAWWIHASRSSEIDAGASEIPKILISPTSSFSGAKQCRFTKKIRIISWRWWLCLHRVSWTELVYVLRTSVQWFFYQLWCAVHLWRLSARL
mgnify:CR=1 FL=1